VVDEYRWPRGDADLRDGLSRRDIVDVLYAPATLRLENRAPEAASTVLVVCAPTEHDRLVVVVCTRDPNTAIWNIVAARDANSNEREIWRKHTS
jgi:uncharacterized DUF497 family protein